MATATKKVSTLLNNSTRILRVGKTVLIPGKKTEVPESEVKLFSSCKNVKVVK